VTQSGGKRGSIASSFILSTFLSPSKKSNILLIALRMKQTITCLIIWLASISLSAQQAPQYSLFSLNKYNFNPAYAGLDNSLSITGVYRKQWVNLPGSPSQQNVNAHLPIYRLNGGFGINIENEEQGPERTTSATASYNYWMPIGKQHLLTIGLSGGLLEKSLDGTRLRAPDGIYSDEPNTIEHNDGSLPLSEVRAMAPIFNAGVYFQSQEFEIGLSVTNLTESQISLMGGDAETKISLNRNYFLIFAGNLEIGSTLTLHPSLLVKSDLIEHQMEISALLKYNDNIFGGASFRGYNSNTADAVAIIAGFKLNPKMTVAYAYDLTLSALQSVSNGSHEIMVNYNLNKAIGAGIPPDIIYNPRFL